MKTRVLLYAFASAPGGSYEATIENVVFLDANGAPAADLFGKSNPGEILADVLYDSPIGGDEKHLIEIADLLVPPNAGVWAAEFNALPGPPFIFSDIEWIFLSPPLGDLDEWELSLRPQRPIIGAVKQGTLCRLCIGAGEVKTGNSLIAQKATCPDCEGTGLLLEAPEHA